MSTNNKRQLRDFQRDVLKLLVAGKNVILQAPTGAGKTDAALLPFIQNIERGGQVLPHTCIYVTPMRVLSTQFYKKYHSRLERIDKERGTDFVRHYERFEREPVSIQTGEQPNDPQFESVLTFCTIDQLLASFLGVPYSVDGRRANLNVGAVLGSYLVLDEFHLYPLLRDDDSCFGARTTAITMLSLLREITPFVLMTATFSRKLLDELQVLLNATLVTVKDEDELSIIAGGRRRMFEVSDTEMDVDTVLERHDKCSLVICNTVFRAQQCYWQLKDRAKQRGIEVILLHSRLTAQDRAARSAMVMHELGQAPDGWPNDERYGWSKGKYYGKNVIVVATQVVEVGLDISVQVLHTEIAPANSLVQRAGRCARFANQEGTVIVYPLPTEAEGKSALTLPYSQPLCEATFQALKKRDPQQPMGFFEEQALIDTVHTEEDTLLLERFKKRQDTIIQNIFTSLEENKRSIVSTLIRDVAQVQILIRDNPETALEMEPWRWQSFTMHPGSLAGRMKMLQERREQLGLEWVCKEAIAIQEERDDETDSRRMTKYKWVELPYSENHAMMTQKLRETVMIVLPSKLATYHDELGFMLLDGRLNVPPMSVAYQSTLLPVGDEGRKKRKVKAMTEQSYQRHIKGLVNAYSDGIRQQTVYVASRLETLLDLPTGSVDHAIRLALACHDLGKLSEQWQQWAWEWQIFFYERQGWQPYTRQSSFFFAKTDFDSASADQRQWQKDTKTKRPNHACESVAVGISLIADSLGVTSPESKSRPLLYTVCAAIARHHTPQAHDYGSVRLKPGAVEVVKEALELARQNLSWMYNLSRLKTEPIEGNTLVPRNAQPKITLPKRGRLHELETWLYFVIVRALRLADQRADKFSD